MELEFGKRVRVGNFYILKHSKSLTKSEQKTLRAAEKIPEEVQEHLSRASLPYIKVSTITDSWSVQFVCGTSMYNAINNLHIVMDGDGNRQLFGVEAKNTEAIFVAMFADTTTVGDFEYMKEKQKLLSAYLERESKRRNKKEDAGKDTEALKKEGEEAVQEIIDRDNRASSLVDMGNDLSNGKEPKNEA